MTLRSLLFVPGDRAERMEKALASGSDALILDLEDAVAPARKAEARAAVGSFLDRPRNHNVCLLVRVNPLGSAYLSDDLTLLAAHQPDGVVFPKAEGAASIRSLRKLGPGLPPILPIATETAAAMFELGSYGKVAANLLGLTWGAEDLSAAIGAATSRDDHGALLPPYEITRSLALFAAHAAGVAAIETIYPDFADLDGLGAYARRAARDGFGGMMAIHPVQVPIINDAFTPTEEQITYAYAIIAAFEANPGAGVVQLDGKMLDAPHLKQAQRLVEDMRKIYQ